ncbi:ABC transporter ATP-binding protein [Glycomyces xiaoerkulensis]|uniref:ABC transporter ATP-binding protein n=1 Tax=Glycomyces xiaoerkulensis TaxID=2038139 RepID=UPI000C262316|nr:ABC transporter ATP-binding protein [Glycomyces xiaoerkulensis]
MSTATRTRAADTGRTVDSAVAVEDLTCRYGTFTAVDRVSIEVTDGELLALLGTNGAGKTTAVDACSGARRPDGGTVRVLGRDPAEHRRELATEVAVIGQESGFADELTAIETLRLWNDLHGRGSDPDAMLERVDLSAGASKRIESLSGGERRRLDLAMALAVRPRVLFADEPTTGLDPASRRTAWRLLRELTETGTAVLLTTHYLEEATELADRVAIMDAGSVVRFGTVEEVTAEHEAVIGARLPRAVTGLDLPVLDGRPELADGRLTIRTDELQHDLHRLLTWADFQGIALEGLRAQPASLDEVFAELASGREH